LPVECPKLAELGHPGPRFSRDLSVRFPPESGHLPHSSVDQLKPQPK